MTTDVVKQRLALATNIKEFQSKCGHLAEAACKAINNEGLRIDTVHHAPFLHLTDGHSELVFQSGRVTAGNTNLALAIDFICKKLTPDNIQHCFYEGPQGISITPAYMRYWLKKILAHLREASEARPENLTLAEGFVAMKALSSEYGPMTMQLRDYEEALEWEQLTVKKRNRNATTHASTLAQAQRNLGVDLPTYSL